jgi:hypothetical protein
MQAVGFTAQNFLEGFTSCAGELGSVRRTRYSRGLNDRSLTAAALFVRFLREERVLPPVAAPPPPADLWPIIGEVRSWMRQHRGLTETTLEGQQVGRKQH